MSKGKKKPVRPPPRRVQVQLNPLLDQNDQAHAYVVKSFIITPEVTLLDAEGREERKYLTRQQYAMFEAQQGDTVRSFLEKRGLKLSSNGNGK